jgi:hypothetical protein
VDSGKLSGIISFNTRSKAWGSVGSNKNSFTFSGHNTVTYDYGCSPFPPTSTPACQTGTTWDTPGEQSGTFDGGSLVGHAGKVFAEVTAGRVISLGAPKGASRYDQVLALTPPQLLNRKAAILSITTFSKSTLMTGGLVAALPKKPSSTYTAPCTSGKAKKTQTTIEYDLVNWTNARRPLTGHPPIGGPLKFVNGVGGQVYVHSYK